MSPKFSITEKKLIDLINNAQSFIYKGEVYKVEFADKPTVAKGECKTDIFIKTDKKDFKISVKQSNADFLENKISYERALQLFGKSTTDVLKNSIETIKESFINHPLICFEKNGRTAAKTIVLGWKFELLNKPGGDKSGLLSLTFEQKIDVFSGTNLVAEKKNATVNGQKIDNSGVADFIITMDILHINNLQNVIDKLIPIPEFVVHQNIYFACKALNYRSREDKWDGDRPLLVSVDWKCFQQKLVGEINLDSPLKVKGNKVGNKLRLALSELKISHSNFDQIKIVYNGKMFP